MHPRRQSIVRHESSERSDYVQTSRDAQRNIDRPHVSTPINEISHQSSLSRGIAILVMGLTGAGKSTFISELTQQDIEIGHTLESCTADVMGYEVRRHNGQKIFLIDTPGFDDTYADNSKVLREIASFLCTICDGDCPIGGLIYVQRITETRMSGSSLKSLRLFEKICGEHCFQDVIIVTTMWSHLRSTEAKAAAKAREEMLRDRPEFFGTLVQGGARMVKYEDSKSALSAVETLAGRKRRILLKIQEEMLLRNDMTLSETAAGRFLEGELADTRKKYELEMSELDEFEAGMADDDNMRRSVWEQKREWMERLKESELYERVLTVTREDLKQERTEWFTKNERYANDANFEGKSSQVLQLKEELLRRTSEMERILELQKMEREENLARFVEKDYKLESLKREYEEQIKKEKANKERLTKFSHFNFFQFLRSAINLNPTKESAQTARRADSPAENKTTKKAPRKSSKKRSSKGKRPGKTAAKSQAPDSRHIEPASNATYPQHDRESSDSELESEGEDLSASQHIYHSGALSEPASPISETFPNMSITTVTPRETLYGPHVQRKYPPPQVLPWTLNPYEAYLAEREREASIM